MRKTIALVTLLIAVFVVSVIAHLPATVTLNHLPLPRQLKIDGVSGTVWHGQAEQVRWLSYDLGSVNWDMHLASLFTGKVAVSTRFGQGSEMNVRGRGVVGIGFGGVFAKSLLVSLPAAQVTSYIRQPVDLTGQIELTLRDYHYAAPWCSEAKGTLAWTKGAVSSPVGAVNLGQVIADVTCKDSRIDVKGNQGNQEVSSEFSATVEANRRYQAQAWFKPGSQFPKELGDLLKHLPNPDGQGRYHFQQQGRF
ncbi:type II secretion system protein N [Vibrio porteresiae]|uniref:Type II secretion system protein N n=1 Tax=Vibrio porteresiae DSM 19223 TaxID=1123496 RepID=A0ABZ0QC34_9VIBR|nr:type II secretion system protein N [Vibrio porteresiae]WPC73969.1 type II secretion system protein N [Vibrio porteresiae DSM 19223]